jgi:hypothetical protein
MFLLKFLQLLLVVGQVTSYVIPPLLCSPGKIIAVSLLLLLLLLWLRLLLLLLS